MTAMRVSESLKATNPWSSNEHSIWLSSNVSLIRNIKRFPFPHKMELPRRQELVPLFGKLFSDCTGVEQLQLVESDQCTALDKEYLYEHFLCTQGFLRARKGEAFIIDQSGTFLGIINVGDHLELLRTTPKGDLEETLSYLVSLETQIGSQVNYAYSDSFGFLTADPEQSGTALQVRLFLQVPALIHGRQFEAVVERHDTSRVELSGLTGSPTQFSGDIVVIKNRFTLGVSEEKILSQTRILATHLLVEEKGMRAQLKKEAPSAVKDAISRAFGLLQYSYNMETFEALDSLSLVKLGIALGWLKGVSVHKVNELIFNCRRAHLSVRLGKKISQEELPHSRADYLHKAVKRLKVTI